MDKSASNKQLYWFGPNLKVIQATFFNTNLEAELKSDTNTSSFERDGSSHLEISYCIGQRNPSYW